ncbi:hypothetical protein CDV55_105850 [Aspergillus turcosus]|nr:hypothetical protein CDV55_105850 [Aspergillus turcosus]
MPWVSSPGAFSLVLLKQGQPRLRLPYIPAKLVDDAHDVIFDYRIQDYYLAPRVEIPAGSEKTPAISRGERLGSRTRRQSSSIGVVPPTPLSQTIRQLEFHRGARRDIRPGNRARRQPRYRSKWRAPCDSRAGPDR